MITIKIEEGQKEKLSTGETGQEEDSSEDVKDQEEISPPGGSPDKPPKAKADVIGTANEVLAAKGKEGKPEEQEKKIATSIADDGIKCVVFLSLQTLTLFRIAASTQAQYDNGDLTLGDFLDTCAEDFFRVRGKKLGLISSGGK